jgi:Holliday junction resolvasome RuvABC endonuclease subunit
MPKISNKNLTKKRKKAKKPIRLKVATPFDVSMLKARGIDLQQAYYGEYLAYSKLIAANKNMCKQWIKGQGVLDGFECFLRDMQPQPFNRYIIVRADKSKRYDASNCSWAMSKLLDNVLAFDPGVQNFGCCHIKKDRVVEAFVLDNTLEYVRKDSFDDDISFFKSEFENVEEKRKPRHIVIERFVPRRFSTGSAESINIAIGLMLAACEKRKIPVTLVMSSTWKNALKKKKLDLEMLYKEAKTALHLKKVMPHTVDAAMLGKYVVNGHKHDALTVAWLRKNMKRLKVH